MFAEGIVFNKNKVELGKFELRKMFNNEVLIRTKYSCISPGTELRCLKGGEDVPSKPYISGYSLVGEVVESKDESIKVGSMVHCSGSKDTGSFGSLWGGHLSHAIADGSSLVLIPDNVDSMEASLTSLGGIAYHGFALTNIYKGENVAVIGLGVLGQLSARLFSIAGGNVVCSDRVMERVNISSKYGINSVQNISGLEIAIKPLQPNGATIVVDATGVQQVMDEVLDVITDIPWDDSPEAETKYLIQGSYSGSFSVPYRKAFVKQVKFIVPRNRQKKDHLAFIQLLTEEKISIKDLIVQVSKPEDAPLVYKDLLNPSVIPGTVVFEW